MKHRKHLVLILIMLFHFSCSREKSFEVQFNILPGKYCFNDGFGIDSLYLYESGNYKHKFYLSETEILESKGIWKYDSIQSKISFYDFIFYNEMGPINQAGGVWNSRVHVSNDGEVRLIYSRENGIFYFKESALDKMD